MFPILAAGSPEATIPSLPAFVVAHDGLYLRKRSLLGVSQTKVDGAEHLPAEKEYLEYALPKVPADLMARVVGFFRAIYRAQRTEALVLLLWAGEGFDLFVPDQRVSPASVSHTLDEAELPSGSRVVGSIHSHGAFGAGASSIDEDDEAEFDGLHVVVGDFDRRASLLLGGDRRRWASVRGPDERRPRTTPAARRAAGGLAAAGEAPAAAPTVEDGPCARVERRHGVGPGPGHLSSEPRRSRRRARSGGPPGRRAWASPLLLARAGLRVESEGWWRRWLAGSSSSDWAASGASSCRRSSGTSRSGRSRDRSSSSSTVTPTRSRTGRGSSSPMTPWARTRPRPWPRCSAGAGWRSRRSPST